MQSDPPPRTIAGSGDRLSPVLDAMSSFVGLCSADGVLLEVNRAQLAVAGVTRDDVIGKPFADGPWWTHPEASRAALVDALDRAARGETVRVDLRARARGDLVITIDYTFSPLRDREGRVVEIVGSGTDVTVRELAWQALQENEERFRQLAETIREVIWLSDPADGSMVYVSPAYESIWGRSAASLYASPGDWLESIHPDDREPTIRGMESVRDAGVIFDGEYRIVRSDGVVRWVRARAFPVPDAAGRIVRIAGVADDVTERRAMEEQVRQSQKMESIGRLAGGIAHDFNNLLTVILGNSELVLANLETGGGSSTLVSEILETAKRGAALTRQLLTFSRQEVFQPRIVDLSAVVADSEPMLKRLLGEDITLRSAMRASNGLVKVDPGHMVQVLLNLAVNARDAMKEGGTLTIETRNMEVDDGYRSIRPDVAPGPYVVLVMTDTGIGMTADVRSHLFEPFFTTKPVGQGTGLGLAVVHGIVERSGGHVRVESEPGRGTTFSICLPSATAVDPAPSEDRRRTLGGTGTILLVEDDRLVRKVGARILAQAGYTVIEAREGGEALQILERMTTAIDLLITDVVMPGVGGRELAERVGERFPDVQLLFISGYPDEAVRLGIQSREMPFLQKPYRTNELLLKVRQVLDRSQKGR